MAAGYSNVQIQVTFVAALDENGNVQQTWWSFAPDTAQMAYTGPQGKHVRPDVLTWKLSAFKIDGSPLGHTEFAETGAIDIAWDYPQPTRKSSSVYELDIYNQNTASTPDGPHKFTATVTYRGNTYTSPDPDVELESRPG
jgi:hypothetical protein